jgi:hypothetical protein
MSRDGCAIHRSVRWKGSDQTERVLPLYTEHVFSKLQVVIVVKDSFSLDLQPLAGRVPRDRYGERCIQSAFADGSFGYHCHSITDVNVLAVQFIRPIVFESSHYVAWRLGTGRGRWGG